MRIASFDDSPDAGCRWINVSELSAELLMNMTSSIRLTAFLLMNVVLAGQVDADKSAATREYDVVVYGGTSAGIAAAVQVRRQNRSVIVLEPSRRIGGLTTGGLGQTDIGNKAAIGGIAREFYQRIRQYYEQPSSWKWQNREEYRDGGQTRTGSGEGAMWTFEPSAALTVMQQLVDEYGITVVYGQRIERSSADGVERTGGRVTALRTEDGNVYRGRTFIDATYEGDLLAVAGVSFTVGREANSVYSETLNGVQTRNARHHQFASGVDPYVERGNPASGLLPGIDPSGPGEEGSGDHRVQGYCFRMCLTDHPENRIPFARPDGYDPLMYELLLRNFEAGENGIPWINSRMPNRKTDTNNRTGFSTDFIGQNYAWPEAGYAEREKIIERHRHYQQGLMWTLANSLRVPEHLRKEIARWGTCRDEFERDDGWQAQLYIREARRMIGSDVMTQHHCQGRKVAEQPVGLAAYTMDSHNVQRYVDANGHVRNEGDVQVGGFSPYPIGYGSIVPKRAECENVLVPVCLSASHIAFGSIRMEPVFMVLGQSAATAALQSIDEGVPVQQIDYAKLRTRLLADQQILEWTGPVRRPAAAISRKSLPGQVVDDEQAELTGFVGHSQVIGPFVEHGYRHDGNASKGKQSARFSFKVETPGRYQIRASWSANANRATNVPVTLHSPDGETTVWRLNQKLKPADGAFGTIAAVELPAGTAVVEISNQGTDGYVIIDAVQIIAKE